MKTEVKNVTVYKNGWIITREGELHLNKGLNHIELEGLSKTSNDDTLKIKFSDGIINTKVIDKE